MNRWICSPSLPEVPTCLSRLLAPTVGFACVLAVIAGARPAAFAADKTVVHAVAPAACSISEPANDDSTDIDAFDEYKAFMQQLFVEEKFGDLDCLANSARARKTKFSGGMWKLHAIYAAFEWPKGHATEEDWNAHFERLNRWVAARPDSITARVALAQSYESYAWSARGDGLADSVTESGWKLFAQRIDKAKEILQGAATLPKCPEWYVAMQRIALAQGWDVPKATQLLQEAVSFEPTYQYFYRMHADFLQPKWYGQEGDSEAFAEQAANRVGGAQGDILYFQIAVNMICRCSSETHLEQMSWPRMQAGFAALEKQSGTSLANLNVLAYIAIKEKDPVTADRAFARIGDNWDEGTWGKKSFFDANKQWAAEVAPSVAWQNSINQAADADMKTPDGIRLKQAFEQKFASHIQQCIQAGGTDLAKFDLLLSLGETGAIQQVTASTTTKVSFCLLSLSRETLLPPPHAPFWLKIPIDPSAPTTTAAK